MKEFRAEMDQESSDEKSHLTEELLSPDEILIAEFEYIAQTAFQANEDRSRATTFYLMG